jgi:hypothetical protein
VYADDQVILLLKFALTIGPVAVYFLTLGYLNAQPRPQIVGGRADFLLLGVIFVPVIVWALLLLSSLSPLVVTGAGCAALAAMFRLLPPKQSSWVIYNVTPRTFYRSLARALGRIGHSIAHDEAHRGGQSVWTVDSLGLRVRVTPFSLLQNVTCTFERLDGLPVRAEQVEPIRRSLRESLGATHTLPSVSAACFLLIGTVMLSAPLLMMARHMDAVVKVVRSLFA